MFQKIPKQSLISWTNSGILYKSSHFESRASSQVESFVSGSWKSQVIKFIIIVIIIIILREQGHLIAC